MTKIQSTSTGTGKYEQLMVCCASLSPISAAVVHPCDESSLTAAVEAVRDGLIQPILVAPIAKLREVVARIGLNLEPYIIVDVPHSQAVAFRAVELVRLAHARCAHTGDAL